MTTRAIRADAPAAWSPSQDPWVRTVQRQRDRWYSDPTILDRHGHRGWERTMLRLDGTLEYARYLAEKKRAALTAAARSAPPNPADDARADRVTGRLRTGASRCVILARDLRELVRNRTSVPADELAAFIARASKRARLPASPSHGGGTGRRPVVRDGPMPNNAAVHRPTRPAPQAPRAREAGRYDFARRPSPRDRPAPVRNGASRSRAPLAPEVANVVTADDRGCAGAERTALCQPRTSDVGTGSPPRTPDKGRTGDGPEMISPLGAGGALSQGSAPETEPVDGPSSAAADDDSYPFLAIVNSINPPSQSSATTSDMILEHMEKGRYFPEWTEFATELGDARHARQRGMDRRRKAEGLPPFVPPTTFPDKTSFERDVWRVNPALRCRDCALRRTCPKRHMEESYEHLLERERDVLRSMPANRATIFLTPQILENSIAAAKRCRRPR
jgi:hypothetical protein